MTVGTERRGSFPERRDGINGTEWIIITQGGGEVMTAGPHPPTVHL